MGYHEDQVRYLSHLLSSVTAKVYISCLTPHKPVKLSLDNRNRYYVERKK